MTDAMMINRAAAKKPDPQPITMTLELLVIPVADVDRARRFYESLGWRLDIDSTTNDDLRIVQFTPPASGCSIMFGQNITTTVAGSSRGMHLVVSDILAARTDLLRRGVEVSDVFHDDRGIFHHSNGKWISSGPNPERKSYASFATFQDPDGNHWTLQEVTARLPGQPHDTRFTKQLREAVWGS